MKRESQTGFTLIELIVALAIAGILLGIGIPSFSGAVKNSQVSSDYSTLTQALFLARSESVKSRRYVTVCPRQSPESRQCGTVVDAWKNGVLVFIDTSPAFGENFATIDANDELLYIHDELRSGNTVTALGSADGSANQATKRAYIRYENTGGGTANWANGSFLLCNAKDPKLSRVLNIAPTGDVRQGRKSGSEYPRDVFSREACVPGS